MKAWKVYSAGEITHEEIAAQPVGQNSVKVKINFTSISLTDRLIYEGKMTGVNLPRIVGREAVGMVTEVGENVKGLVRGDIAAIDPYVYCGICPSCRSGKGAGCDKILTRGVDEDGFLCDFAVVSEDDVYKLPDIVNETDAVFLEHIAMAINAFNKIKPEKGEYLVISGATVVGIVLAQIALYHQVIPILVDANAAQLDLAQTLSVYYTINSVDTDVKKKILTITGGKMAETAAHFCASAISLSNTLDYVGKGGRVAVVGWKGTAEGVNVPLASAIDKQLSIACVNNGNRSISSAINMLVHKIVTVAPLISKTVPFIEAGETIKEMSALPNKYLKVLVKI